MTKSEQHVLDSLDLSTSTIAQHPDRNDMIVQVLEQIDHKLSQQINRILHHSVFQQVESIWTGILLTLKSKQHSDEIKLKICHLTKNDLQLMSQQSHQSKTSFLRQKVHDNEFNIPGGEPYSLLIGDYQFDHSAVDVATLRYLATICSQSLCPFISSTKPQLFKLEHWDQVHQVSSINSLASLPEHSSWRQLRLDEKSKFIVLTIPNFLGRHKYTANCDSMNYSFTETMNGDADYLWVNAAFAQACCIMNAFKQHGWCTAIRGFSSGGKVDSLPLTQNLKATQAQFNDEQEFQFSKQGITAMCHYRHTDFAVIFAAETLHLPAQYDSEEATANAKISARLPYILASSRIGHYIKVIARDKIGSFMEIDDIEHWLNKWISQYVNSNARSKEHLKSKFPLAEAQITVSQSANNPGRYDAIVHMRPWLQFEELSASVRLVTKIHSGKHK